MSQITEHKVNELLIHIRKIIQAIDIHSKALNKKYGLTGPQLIILHEISNNQGISITPLAKSTSLKQATVTDITKRLEVKGYLTRKKREDDKRSVSLFLTGKGKETIESLPPILQNKFIDRFANIESWEQTMILSSFERVVNLMAAEEIDASPILVTGSIQEPDETI